MIHILWYTLIEVVTELQSSSSSSSWALVKEDINRQLLLSPESNWIKHVVCCGDKQGRAIRYGVTCIQLSFDCKSVYFIDTV